MTKEGEKGQQDASSKLPGIEISADSAKKSRETVVEKLREKRDEMIDKVKEIFGEKISYGGPQMSEQAKHQILLIRDKEINEISRTYNTLIIRFEKGTEGVKDHTSSQLEDLAKEVMANAERKTKNRIQKLQVVLAKKVEGDFMDIDDVAEIDKSMEGIKDFERNHPELNRLFVRIGEGAELNDDDYETIIGLINPHDIARAGVESDHALETMSAGLLISLMSQGQRFELMEKLMDSGIGEHTAKLLDAFLKTGILTQYQGEQLYEMAVTKGVITQEKYDSDIKEKIEGDYYTQQAESFREAVSAQTKKDIGGRFSKNIVERVVDIKPMAHALLMVGGGFTAVMNILASREKGDLGATLKNIASNEFFWLGLGAAGVGYEGVTGSLRTGRKRGGALDYVGLGEGHISELIDECLRDEDKEQIQKRRAAKLLIEQYLNAPSDLRAYLENGGNNTLLELKKEKKEDNDDDHTTAEITLDRLIEIEDRKGNADQKARLEALQARNQRADKPIDKMFFAIAASAEALEIDEKKAKMAEWSKKIRESQTSA